ncbi:YeeE/YedE family protein [Ectobacillus sp. sgz5001026]|uniref:YeeE/YedE family protein n=1 Tax=Ectobacillus sp. sgz5001026 TaxID=3242473 RepID=UPI0036D32AF8
MSNSANATQIIPTKSRGIVPKNNQAIIYITLLLFVLGAVWLGNAFSGKQAELYVLGGFLGLALYHAHYGFTSSFRYFLSDKKGVGIRAQMILFVITNLLFLPFLIKGTMFGHPVVASISPVGVSLLFGAFLFGIGMQMGDGCASGTLYHLGGGDARSVITLVGFIIGSVIGSAHFIWWTNLPHLQPISFLQSFGTVGGFAFNLLLIAIVFFITIFVERRSHGKLETVFSKEPFSLKMLLQGPWSWMAGTIALAIGGVAFLLIAGKPWGITSAFALWGAKVSGAIGIPVETWGYWKSAPNAAALNTSVFHDGTTVSDIGIMLGALLAVALSGKAIRFSLRSYPFKMLVGLMIGGILMGYGARLAFGCNIGAYFSGIASFSLHGWVWMIMAMLGSIVGIQLRNLSGFKRKNS